jgi:hypothetical protein
MRKHTPEEIHAIKLRVDRDLLEEIRKLAIRENRSVNNYFNNLLRQHVASFINAPRPKK